MADRRIKDITIERLTPNSDDNFAIDGVTGGTARIPAGTVLQQDVGLPFVIRESPMTTGMKGCIEVPCNCDVTGWGIFADQAGSIVVDIFRNTFAAYPAATSIAGTEKPTLSSVIKNQDTSLTTWTTALTKGDILRFNVDSVATVTNVTISIRARRRM